MRNRATAAGPAAPTTSTSSRLGSRKTRSAPAVVDHRQAAETVGHRDRRGGIANGCGGIEGGPDLLVGVPPPETEAPLAVPGGEHDVAVVIDVRRHADPLPRSEGHRFGGRPPLGGGRAPITGPAVGESQATHHRGPVPGNRRDQTVDLLVCSNHRPRRLGGDRQVGEGRFVERNQTIRTENPHQLPPRVAAGEERGERPGQMLDRAILGLCKERQRLDPDVDDDGEDHEDDEQATGPDDNGGHTVLLALGEEASHGFSSRAWPVARRRSGRRAGRSPL